MLLTELVLALNQMGERGSLAIDENQPSNAGQIDRFFKQHCPEDWNFKSVWLQSGTSPNVEENAAVKDCRIALRSNTISQDHTGQFLCSVFYLWYKTRHLTPAEIEEHCELIAKAVFD